MKISEAPVMKRLLTYMWCYKWLTALALVFTFLTSLLLTAIPLAARWYIDHLVAPKEADSPVMNAFQFLILYYGLPSLYTILFRLSSLYTILFHLTLLETSSKQ